MKAKCIASAYSQVLSQVRWVVHIYCIKKQDLIAAKPHQAGERGAAMVGNLATKWTSLETIMWSPIPDHLMEKLSASSAYMY